MQTIRTIPLLLALAVTAVALPLRSSASMTGDPSDARPQDNTWMPDVAERVAELRERTARAEVEARARTRDEHARSGQWWRAAVAAPAGDRAR